MLVFRKNGCKDKDYKVHSSRDYQRELQHTTTICFNFQHYFKYLCFICMAARKGIFRCGKCKKKVYAESISDECSTGHPFFENIYSHWGRFDTIMLLEACEGKDWIFWKRKMGFLLLPEKQRIRKYITEVINHSPTANIICINLSVKKPLI